ncbi:hypothetical protein F5Y06DRAFT_297993 [Hypoxylon sp. FL0890]|nr:hypothetical protein F5Y06DRAFT_297993 [Hypoxylon sp. FL0890]
MAANQQGESKKEWQNVPDDYKISRESEKHQSTDNLPSYREAAEDNATAMGQPPCAHWSEASCSLKVHSRKCCACTDERPQEESGRYPMYVDGKGWVDEAERWQYYCPPCQAYFDPDASEKLLKAQREWAETAEKGRQTASGDLGEKIRAAIRLAKETLRES